MVDCKGFHAGVSGTRRGGVAWRASLAAIVLVAAHSVATAGESSEDWPMFGQNVHNTASVQGSSLRDVGKLKVKWSFTTGGDVSARAAVVDGRAYFPDWGGNLWAVDVRNGSKVWGHQLSDYGLPAKTHSRTSPAVADGVVYVGTQEGAWLLAIDARNGKLLWKTQLESPANDAYAMVTASPAVADDLLFTGVASNEEGNAGTVPGFVCCKSRGSVVAVHLQGPQRGKIAWKTYTVPAGYTGGGIWGSNVVVDGERGSVFAGSGNNYSQPVAPAYLACIAGGGTAATCNSPEDHVDSILALDMRSGRIKWARKFVTWSQPGVTDGSDDWNVSCVVPINPANCPSGAGPDYDFGSAPNLITFDGRHGRRHTILGAGQKSGIYYALDPDNGAELWHTQVGPGSSLGGMEWGSATDGKRIYVSIANLYGIPTATGGAGSWSALDPETGAILWQVGDPNGAITVGPLTVVDDVVFASSMAGSPTAPTMLALDARSGQTLWTFASGSSVNAGAAIADGVVYWGAGYAHLGLPGFTGNDKFFAFSRNGR